MKVCVCPTFRERLVGDTVTEIGRTGAVTVIVADEDFEGSATEVAVSVIVRFVVTAAGAV